ncbi:putative protein S-acyltransferase 16, partial [Dictyocoela roeselum]
MNESLIELRKSLIELRKSLALLLYPVSSGIVYFILVGIYAIYEHRFAHVTDCVFFILFQAMVAFNLIFYLKLLSSRYRYTVTMFPQTGFRLFKPNVEDLNLFVAQEVIEKGYIKMRVCFKCTTYKPPRCHHCSKCGKCHLKMDHHSMPFNRCIDFFNYKTFVQFLILNCISSIFFLYLLMDVYSVCEPPYAPYYIFGIVVLTLKLLVFLGLTAFHMFLILNNETTIEHYAIQEFLTGDFTKRHIFQEGPVTRPTTEANLTRGSLNPYNISCMKNWEQVF